MNYKSDVDDYDFEFKAETEKAILVWDGTKEYWLPKSQIEYERKGKNVRVTIPEWLAKKHSLL